MAEVMVIQGRELHAEDIGLIRSLLAEHGDWCRTRNQPGIAGKATAYVCVNYACRAPTTDINEMLNQLGMRAAAKES